MQLLMDKDGNVIQKEELKGLCCTASDDMRSLDNGSVGQTWVEEAPLTILSNGTWSEAKGVLRVCKLPIYG